MNNAKLCICLFSHEYLDTWHFHIRGMHKSLLDDSPALHEIIFAEKDLRQSNFFQQFTLLFPLPAQ